MAKTKEKKKKIIEDLKEKMKQQKIMVFFDFTGTKVKDLFELRRRLKSVDSQLKVIKKTLLKFVFENYDVNLFKEVKNLKGQLAMVLGFKDEISPAKILYQFSEVNPNLKILGGYFDNKFRGAEEIIILAKLPRREELLAKLVESIRAPISNLVNVLEGNLRGLVLVLSRIKS